MRVIWGQRGDCHERMACLVLDKKIGAILGKCQDGFGRSLNS